MERKSLRSLGARNEKWCGNSFVKLEYVDDDGNREYTLENNRRKKSVRELTPVSPSDSELGSRMDDHTTQTSKSIDSSLAP
jgi:hypothetical protein